MDDEPLALELLEDNIRQVPYLKLVGKCSNAIDALTVLNELQVDLVFLDIQMPGLTGLQFIKSLAARPMFILVTAYEKFAIEGFNLNVVDYLVKPVALDRFIAACNKANELYELRNTDGKQQDDYFFINVDYSLVKVVYSNIAWIESLKDYIKVYLKDNSKPLVARLSLKSLEEELPAELFIRIHKSYIISKNAITSLKKSSVLLTDNTELPVGDNYKERIDALVNGKRLD
ncbi:MAG: response regulator transcription factor [Chitinophagaceae bacterium]|nr:MAG: response regulator transcription factor [Chitinophagaceae bacterium]